MSQLLASQLITSRPRRQAAERASAAIVECNPHKRPRIAKKNQTTASDEPIVSDQERDTEHAAQGQQQNEKGDHPSHDNQEENGQDLGDDSLLHDEMSAETPGLNVLYTSDEEDEYFRTVIENDMSSAEDSADDNTGEGE